MSKIIELNEKPALIITTALSLAQKIPEKNYFFSYGLLNLKVGQIFKTTEFVDELIKYGYKRTHTVENMGEFSVRGSLIDIFPIGKELPYRIDFYEENIEGIRIFEPSDQRTVGRQNGLKIRAIDYEFIDNNLNGNILDLMGKNTSLILSNPKSIAAR